MVSNPPPVYSSDPNDAWNRMFSLFTRTVKAHVSVDFADRAPFGQIQYVQFPHELSVSTRMFERIEMGDRAIEPLYPSFLSSVGTSQVLSEPLYSQRALRREPCPAENAALKLR